MSRYRLTEDDRRHARAFLADPDAPPDPGLQRVLNRLRTEGQDGGGKYVLVVEEAHRRWQLARTPGRRGEPVQRVQGVYFDNRLDAERYVFRLRWQQLTGRELPE